MARLILIWIISAAFAFVAAADRRSAAGNEPHVHIFRAQTCDYCDRAMNFLKRLQDEDKRIRMHDHNVDSSAKEAILFLNLVDSLELSLPVIPIIFVGRVVVIGFESNETTGRDIRGAIESCRINGCPDLVPGYAGDTDAAVATRAPPSWTIENRSSVAAWKP